MLKDYIRPLVALAMQIVKTKLHEVVESIDETDVHRFKLALHQRIDKL